MLEEKIPGLHSLAKNVLPAKGQSLYRTQFGKLGEELAASYLAAQGYDILAKNYRRHSGEIDIIAGKADTLLAVEVKTRLIDFNKKTLQYHPAFGINETKKKHLKDTFTYFIEETSSAALAAQVDLIVICLFDKQAHLNEIVVKEKILDFLNNSGAHCAYWDIKHLPMSLEHFYNII